MPTRRSSGTLERIAIALAVIAALAFCGWFVLAPVGTDASQPEPTLRADQTTHDARGFGTTSARVDPQITLAIPDGRADDVYTYLRDTYASRERVLGDRFPHLRLSGEPMSDESIFIDDYYDTPALDLYRTRNSVRHRTRFNTTNPDDRKSGRQLVQVKVTPPGEFELRSELKFKVAKMGRKEVVAAANLPPLLRLVDPRQRKDFARVFTAAGVDALALRRILTIRQVRKRVYIDWDGKGILTLSVDQGTSEVLWAKGSYSSVDMALTEVTYTEADEAKRKAMWEIRDAIITDLESHFDGLSETSDSKYGIVLSQLIEAIPGLPRLVRFGLVH